MKIKRDWSDAPARYGCPFALMVILILGLGWLECCERDRAYARDAGQWDASSSDVRKWFSELMQPDQPSTPCCGESDAYWADSYEVHGDQYVAIITDERPDAPLARPHRNVGEKIIVPNAKIKWDAGNPVGHGLLFIGSGGSVYCYVPPGGV